MWVHGQPSELTKGHDSSVWSDLSSSSECHLTSLVLLGRSQEPQKLTIQYHAFNAAVCMGTLVLQDPRNMLASYALSLIDSAITLFTSIIQTHSTTRLLRNLEWLLKIRQRASSRINAASTTQADCTAASGQEEDDAELIGWRTRLVQRLGKGAQLATTITPTQSAATPSPNTAMARTISQALQNHFVTDDGTQGQQHPPPVPSGSDQGTDMLVSRCRNEYNEIVSPLSSTSSGTR